MCIRDSATAARLRKLTQRQLIVAGGICSQQEVDELDVLGICLLYTSEDS